MPNYAYARREILSLDVRVRGLYVDGRYASKKYADPCTSWRVRYYVYELLLLFLLPLVESSPQAKDNLRLQHPSSK